jgi:hypothetical protein
VYEQLIRVSEEGTLAPALADKLERRGRGLFFQIRRGAAFSDGSPVQAADVIASLRDHSLGARKEEAGIFVEPPITGAPLDATLPFVVVSRRVGDRALGSGAFKTTAEAPDRIVLERVQATPNRIQRIELLGFPTPREALARTLAGDAELMPRVEPGMAEFFDRVNRLRLVRGRSTQAVSVGFNVRLSIAERRALAAVLANGSIGHTAFGKTCSAYPQPVGRSVLPAGRKLRVVSPLIDVGYERLALAVRRALGPRGGEVQTLNVTEAFAKVLAGNFELFTAPVLVWPPPLAGFIFHSTAPRDHNVWGYSDAAVDEALEGGDWPAAFAALFRNPPVLFICLQEKLVAVDSRIKNPKLGPLAPLEFVPDWEVSQ